MMARFLVEFTSADGGSGVSGEFESVNEFDAVLDARERFNISEADPDFPVFTVTPL